MFVTTAQFTGDLGGLAGADAKCQLAADNIAPGSAFLAWLSITGTNAVDRVVGEGPWYSADRATLLFTGKTMGANPLVGLSPAAPITENELGQILPKDTFYWTGTKGAGVASAQNCVGWTTASGAAAGGNGGETGEASLLWTFTNGNVACNTPASLLCIEK